MIKTIRGGYGKATDQIFAPTMDAFDKSLDDASPYDPARAKAAWPRRATRTASPFRGRAPGRSSPRSTPRSRSTGARSASRRRTSSGRRAKPSSRSWPATTGSCTSRTSSCWTPGRSSSSRSRRTRSTTRSTPRRPSSTSSSRRSQHATDAERPAAGQAVNKYLVEHYWYGPLYRPAMFYLTAPGIDLTVYPGYVQPPIWAFAPAK
ncbi:hypothetical protein [Microbacterium elymi]|uniref:hypothetical protein n=1 Tax=Microbacterium elymi TaxID=2909587 RepID=UPI00338F95CB